jgi:hypothetical protein
MYKRRYVLAILIFWSALAWGADATGFAITMPCGSPPFGTGATDMHVHLIHFPKQTPGRELVLMMPSMLGPTGVTDWVNAVGKLCTPSRGGDCSNAQSARVRVLNYSTHNFLGKVLSPHISGEFEVRFSDGTNIEGTFAAKEQKSKQFSKAVCE